MKRSWLRVYAILVATCSLLLPITGTFVTTNEARPLFSVGLVHPWVGAAVGVLTIGLILWLSTVKLRACPRWLGWATLSALAIEALLGLPEAPRPLAVRFSHTILAYLFFSAIVAIALFASQGSVGAVAPAETAHKGPPLRLLAVMAWIAVMAQVTIGAAFRYAAVDVILHILGAMVVMVVALIVGFRAREQFTEHPAPRLAAVALIASTLLQVLLGTAVLTIQAINPEDPLPVILLISVHAATAALTLAASLVLAIQVDRYLSHISPTVGAPKKPLSD